MICLHFKDLMPDDPKTQEASAPKQKKRTEAKLMHDVPWGTGVGNVKAQMAELKRQGIRVIMTPTRDTLINLADRAGYCAQDCSLFVSLHVDALDARARKRYGEVRGFHTIIIGEENSEDADRVAAMENDALRYEVPPENESADGLDFILRNLQRNE